MQEWQNKLLAIPMNWQILGHPRVKAFTRNDSFHSGMAVSLTCQSCGLACPQRLILPLLEYKTHVSRTIDSQIMEDPCTYDYCVNTVQQINLISTLQNI